MFDLSPVGKSLRGSGRRRATGRKPPRPRLAVEPLDGRILLTVFANFVNGQLQVTDDSFSDLVTLDHSGTNTLVNGSANYADLWIKPSFAIGIQSLNGKIAGLSSYPKSRAKVQLDGKVDRYAPWKVAGEVNLLSAALFTDLTMSFDDVDLTVVNPYSGHFVGYRIDKG